MHPPTSAAIRVLAGRPILPMSLPLEPPKLSSIRVLHRRSPNAMTLSIQKPRLVTISEFDGRPILPVQLPRVVLSSRQCHPHPSQSNKEPRPSFASKRKTKPARNGITPTCWITARRVPNADTPYFNVTKNIYTNRHCARPYQRHIFTSHSSGSIIGGNSRTGSSGGSGLPSRKSVRSRAASLPASSAIISSKSLGVIASATYSLMLPRSLCAAPRTRNSPEYRSTSMLGIADCPTFELRIIIRILDFVNRTVDQIPSEFGTL